MQNWFPRLRMWWRRRKQDVRVFAKLFPWYSALALTVVIGLSAWGFQCSYRTAYPGERLTFSYVKAVYAILNMLIFNISYADMPPTPALDVFFVAVPVLGIPALLVFGANVLGVVRVFFVRKERDQAWQRALAATVRRPIVVCGLGRIGYRVVDQLLTLGREVTGIEAIPSVLVNNLMDRDVPVILSDARSEDALRWAGVERAQAVLICTDDDLVNIETASRVRELNPRARIVLRLFDDQIAAHLREAFRIEAVVSRSAMAAQAFANAAVGIEVIETFAMEPETYLLARIPIHPQATLAPTTIRALIDKADATLIGIYHRNILSIEPGNDAIIEPGDALLVFVDAAHLHLLCAATMNCTHPVHDQEGLILVCGIGHIGYRVARALQAMQRSIKALELEHSLLAERLKTEGIEVLYGDFRQHPVLIGAGIAQATSIVICTEDDMANFETALRAREINPEIRVVMRIFEEQLAERLQRAFSIDAVYSSSAIAAPGFVSAALGIHLAQPVNVAGQQMVLARLKVEPLSSILGDTIADLTGEQDLTVLLHKHAGEITVPPTPLARLASGDEIVVLASQAKLKTLTSGTYLL